jgi:hypothetical protein
MSKRIGALAAIVTVLGLSTGVASAAHIGVGSGAPPSAVLSFRGWDGVGVVRFKVDVWDGPPTTLRTVAHFTFANKCSSTGTTTVTAQINVGPKLRFKHVANGITILGGFGPKVKGAAGTVEIVTGTCDSGPLNYTAAKT